MKTKLLLQLIGLGLVCGFAVPRVQAQGTVNFNNRVTGVVVAPVYGPEPGNPTWAKHGNTSAGTPAESTIYSGVLLADTNYTAELWAGPQGTPEASLSPVIKTSFRTLGLSGYLLFISSVTIPGVSSGGIATLQLRVWDNRTNTVTSWAMAQAMGVASGVSLPFDSPPLGDGATIPPANMTGLRSFNIHLPSPPPIITCVSDKTVECGSAWTFDTPTASASCGGTNVALTIVSTVTNGICPATATRTWQATDLCAYSVQCSQTVTMNPACIPALSPSIGWKGEGTPEDTTGSHPGVWFGTPSYAGGKVGAAFLFHGVNYLHVTDSDALSPGATGGAMTIEGWVYPVPWQGTIVSKGSGPGLEYSLALDPTNGNVVFTVGLTDMAPPSAVPFSVAGGTGPSNQWHHVAGVFQYANTIAVYLDGNRVGTANVPPLVMLNAGDFVSIGRASVAGQNFSGSIDELSLYPTALDDATIQRIYFNGAVGKCPPSNCVAPPVGLVSWWPGNSNATDIVSGHDGTLSNGASFTNGEVGQAFLLDGVSQYVEVPSSPAVSFGPTAPMSVALWAYRTGGGNVMHLLGKRDGCGGSSTEINYQIALNMISGEGLTFGPAAGYSAASGLDLPMNVWTHLAGTFDRTNLSLYINGELKVTRISSLGPENSAPLLIGGSGSCTPFAGRIDEVSLYNRALTPAEVQQQYAAASHGLCAPSCAPLPSGLLAWWRGEGNAQDVTGAYPGLLNGATFASGEAGQGFRLAGTNDSVILGTNVGNFGSSDFTVEFWMQTSGFNQPVLGKHRPCGAGNYWDLKVFEGQILVELATNDTAYAQTASSREVSDGRFHHVAMVRQSTTLKCYLDGALEGSITVPVVVLANADPLELGLGYMPCPGFPDHTFAGILDEVTLYTRALSDAEIQAVHASGSLGKCPPTPCGPLPAGLVAWWPGDGDAADLTQDHSAAPLYGADFASGVVGQAFHFDGTNDYLKIPFDPSLFALSRGTLEMWVKIPDPSVDVIPLFTVSLAGYELYAPESHWWLLFYRSAPWHSLQLAYGNHGTLGLNALTPTNSYTDTAFHHVAVVVNGVDWPQIYLDGVSQPLTHLQPPNSDPEMFFSVAYTGHNNPADTMSIGALVLDTTNANGPKFIDEVTVYNRGLSAAEVQALYQAGSSGKCKGDSDGDGLPDAWEMAHGLNRYDSADANADGDHDGMTNTQEYSAGTNPQDASSVLRITDLQFDSGGPTVNNLHFTFQAQANKSYSLFQAGGLDTSKPDLWQKFMDVPASPTNRVLRLHFQSEGSQTFIRVVTP